MEREQFLTHLVSEALTEIDEKTKVWVNLSELQQEIVSELIKHDIDENSEGDQVAEIFNNCVADHIETSIEQELIGMASRGLISTVVTEKGELGYKFKDK